jgi:hypothetical protein
MGLGEAALLALHGSPHHVLTVDGGFIVTGN